MVGNIMRVGCLACVFAFSCVACSDDDDDEEEATESGTCNGIAAVQTCTENEGSHSFIEGEQRFCVDVGDTWTTDPCPVSADLIGCCRERFGDNTWLDCYYTGHAQTAMDLESDCVLFEGRWTAGGKG